MSVQIEKVIPAAKYHQIGERLKGNILDGKYSAGEKLPTYRELAKHFDTTMVTISNAVKMLEAQGYINRVPGSGMFVQEPESRKRSSVKFKKTGLLMAVKADLYQNMADALINILEEFDYEAVPLGIKINDYKTSVEDKEKLIRKYVERAFDSLIISGERHFPSKLLYKYKSYFKQINFITHYESVLDFPGANIITADYEKVGYLGGKYLMEQNKKRIAFLTYAKLSPALNKRLGSREFTADSDVLNGMKRAMREIGVEPDVHVVSHFPIGPEQKIAEMEIKDFMKQGDCGIMTMGDNRALTAYHAAHELGLQFGEHCSIIGMFNTPWTEILKPSLTSISINEREIGCLAGKAVIEGWKGKKIKVEPELIVRET